MEARWHGSRSDTAMVYQPTLLPQAREQAGRASHPDWVITFSDGIIYLHDAGLRPMSYLLTWARPNLRPKNKRVGTTSSPTARPSTKRGSFGWANIRAYLLREASGYFGGGGGENGRSPTRS